MKDLIEILTNHDDGDYNTNINAYVTSYQSGEDEISFELEYVDVDNDEEVIEIKRFTVKLFED